jgi:hypothetical protein
MGHITECIGAQGYVVPPFIIFAATWHKDTWYDELPHDWKIAVSKNGWTTNELSLEWIKHFDRYTRPRTKETYHSAYFGWAR